MKNPCKYYSGLRDVIPREPVAVKVGCEEVMDGALQDGLYIAQTKYVEKMMNMVAKMIFFVEN